MSYMRSWDRHGPSTSRGRSSRPGRPSLVCYNCQGRGHKAAVCPSKAPPCVDDRRQPIRQVIMDENKELEETETQLMKRLSDAYDAEQLIDEGPKMTTPVAKARQKRPILDSSSSDSESDSDTDNKMSAVRWMIASPPVKRPTENIADRVKTSGRKAATKPKIEPVADIIVEGNQLRMKFTYLRPKIVQPGYSVKFPGILWEFSSDKPVPN